MMLLTSALAHRPSVCYTVIHIIPSTSARQNPQRKCVVCAKTTTRPKKRTDTRYECTECDVGLCISGCFQDYHNLKYF